MTRLSRLWRHARGIYSAGAYDVTVKHWWSRSERKSARLTAMIVEHEAPKIDAEARQRITDHMLYGSSVIGPDGKRVDPRDIRPKE